MLSKVMEEFERRLANQNELVGGFSSFSFFIPESNATKP